LMVSSRSIMLTIGMQSSHSPFRFRSNRNSPLLMHPPQ
jgi:hypothetical protein